MTLTELLNGKPPEAFSSDQLRGKAHWRWDRDQHYAAFLLFDASWERGRVEGDETSANASRSRAAITLHQSGRNPDEAGERLDAVLRYYEAHPVRTDDRHFVEWVATALLERQLTRDPAGFSAAFWRLREPCAAAGRANYPWIRPQRVQIAGWAEEAGARDVLRYLLPALKPNAPCPAP